MPNQQPTVHTMGLTEARDHFDNLVRRVSLNEARVVVEDGGSPVVAIISAADFELLRRMEARRAERFKVIDRMREAFKDVPEDELDREVEKALAEVRAESRAAKKQQRA